jgi:hypothetical protein
MMIDCPRCEGKGYVELPSKDVGAILCCNCKDCNGIGKIELRAMTFEGSCQLEQMQKVIKDLTYERDMYLKECAQMARDIAMYKARLEMGVTNG